MSNENKKMLYLELHSLENQGITIWLDGIPCSSRHVSKQLDLNESNLYMRDYIFDKGVLREIRFDRVKIN